MGTNFQFLVTFLTDLTATYCIMSSRRSRKEEKGQVAYLIIKPRKPSQLSPPPPASKDNENSISMFKFAFLLVLVRHASF